MLDLLPLATVVAIAIFITKETIEIFRRLGERRRKKRAIRSLIRDELTANHLALVQVSTAIEAAAATDYYKNASDAIVTGHGGRVFYRRFGQDGEVLAGSLIRSVKTTEYQRLLPLAAELDLGLYRMLREGYYHVQDLDNIVTSFVDHAGVIPDEKEWFPSFREWASRRLQVISNEILHLYERLGGKRSEIKVPPSLKDGSSN